MSTIEEKIKSELDVLWSNCELLLITDYELLDSNKIENISKMVIQISTILVENSTHEEMESVLLNFCKQNDIFNKIYRWTGLNRKYLKPMASLQLSCYNTLIQKASGKLLACKQVMIPLLLLMLSLKPTDTRRTPHEVEFLYVNILYNISQRISNTYLLDLLSHDLYTPNEDFKIPRFTFFELLLFYTHKPGEIGDLARLAILTCLKFSIRNDPLNEFICHQTVACAIIAGGLSARYSSLPTTLVMNSEGWHTITKTDLENLPVLRAFLNCLSFCCNVMDCGNHLVNSRLTSLIHDGFLMSVLAPALNQSPIEAQIAALAYLDLSLRFISSEYLMEIFLKFLLTEAYDNKSIINLLISCMTSDSEKLAMVTIRLFQTMFDLNCEDVLFDLILKYLLPCNHILPNQKRIIKEMDFYCKSAIMFLYLIPASCIEAKKEDEEVSPLLPQKSSYSSTLMENKTDNSLQAKKKFSVDSNGSQNSFLSKDSYSSLGTFDLMEYLADARKIIMECKRACKCWSNAYDGMDVIIDNYSEKSSYTSNMVRTKSTISTKTNRSATNISINGEMCLGDARAECIGPFLNALFDKLEKMTENSFHLNLCLTSLVTRLACYPQPLLRSFLLNSNLVIQPGVRSLSQVLARVSTTSDAFVSQFHDYRQLIRKARQHLMQPDQSKYFTEDPSLFKDLNNTELTVNCTLQSNEDTQAIYEQKSPILSNTLSVDDILCRSPWSLFHKEQHDNKNEKRVSLNTRHSKLHPVIPKLGLRSSNKKDFKNQTTVDKLDSHVQNLLVIKKAVYCVIVLEEFMKELAAVSIEQTLL
ncbi:FHIP family protein v1g243165 isoform X1 [Hydra vulgaris]|nr:FHIP family protein v1g243165 isoform X1 [Hydra vulgaris]